MVRGEAVDGVEVFGGGAVDQSLDDVRADALSAPPLRDADAGEFAERLVGLVDPDAPEARLLAGLLVERDDVIAGPEGAVVESEFVQRVEQPDLVSVLRVSDVHVYP